MDDPKKTTDPTNLDVPKQSEMPNLLPVDGKPLPINPTPAQINRKPTLLSRIAGISHNTKVAIIGGSALVLVAGATAIMLWPHSAQAPETAQTQQLQVKELGVAVGLTEGLVQFSEDATTWQDITVDTDLHEGDSVRTATDGRVVLLIDDGSAIRLNSNSEVTLTNLNVDNVVITNTTGTVYNRVVASETRQYSVKVDDETYKAIGTAYRTFNEENKKGVEVFQSTVAANKENKDVPEGNYYFIKHEQADKQGAVLALDIEALKNDDFIKWNSEQDKKVAEYADKLGILDELSKPAPTPPPTPTPTPKTSTPAAGITLSGKASEYSAVFSWKSSGVDTAKGFKLVRSSKTTTPTYPDNSVAYIDAGKTSYTLFVGDDTTYHYRICAYREKTCESYSNTVSIATQKKVKAAVEPGAVTLALNGASLSWTIQGTAPHGYKVVVGTSTDPSYGNNYKKYFTEQTYYDLPAGDFTPGTPYYVKVCKYSDSGCTDYSNEVVYTP